jgi:hypothetical protein
MFSQFPLPDRYTSGMVQYPLTGGEPAGAGHAVWTVGQAESHNAILFDDATPGWNFGIRPQAGETLTVRFVKPLFTGRQRVMAHVGHLHGAVGLNDVDVQMQCRIQHETFPAMFHEYDVQLAEINDASEPMALLTEVVDRDDVLFPWGDCRLEVEFTIDATAVDPEHPLGLFGIRLTDE